MPTQLKDQLSFGTIKSFRSYGLAKLWTECLCSSEFICRSLNPQCDGIKT